LWNTRWWISGYGGSVDAFKLKIEVRQVYKYRRWYGEAFHPVQFNFIFLRVEGLCPNFHVPILSAIAVTLVKVVAEKVT
jgi:hypothetical protein